uniref:uncharacterized protein LOC120342406 isoform X2 n=1 Tax=Styela clava TaxID=7725 RepID=UPI00193A2662|nr:uncharacterized protein LOC120342406 isoform X2 [Styela clava]
MFSKIVILVTLWKIACPDVIPVLDTFIMTGPDVMKDKVSTLYSGNYALTYFHEEKDNVSFYQAQSLCTVWRQGARLVVIEEKYVNEAVGDLLAFWAFPAAWIGGTDIHHDGYWTWIDGTPIDVNYTNWKHDEPNGGIDENCLAINHYGTPHLPPMTWFDAPCDEKKGYICQIDMRKALTSDFTASVIFSDELPSEGNRTMSYWDAVKSCQSEGRLVEIDHVRIFEAIRRKSKRSDSTVYWIGGKNSFSNSSNKCLGLGYNGWDEYDCNSSLHYVCESILPHELKIENERPIIAVTGNLRIKCSASGYPTPEVRWGRYERIIEENTDHSLHQILENGASTLVLNNAVLDDTGRYRCHATNYFNGTEHTVKGFLDLSVLPYGVYPSTIPTLHPDQNHQHFSSLKQYQDESPSFTTPSISSTPSSSDLKSENTSHISIGTSKTKSLKTTSTDCQTNMFLLVLCIILGVLWLILLGYVIYKLLIVRKAIKNNNTGQERHAVYTVENGRHELKQTENEERL